MSTVLYGYISNLDSENPTDPPLDPRVPIDPNAVPEMTSQNPPQDLGEFIFDNWNEAHAAIWDAASDTLDDNVPRTFKFGVKHFGAVPEAFFQISTDYIESGNIFRAVVTGLGKTAVAVLVGEAVGVVAGGLLGGAGGMILGVVIGGWIGGIVADWAGEHIIEPIADFFFGHNKIKVDSLTENHAMLTTEDTSGKVLNTFTLNIEPDGTQTITSVTFDHDTGNIQTVKTFKKDNDGSFTQLSETVLDNNAHAAPDGTNVGPNQFYVDQNKLPTDIAIDAGVNLGALMRENPGMNPNTPLGVGTIINLPPIDNSHSASLVNMSSTTTIQGFINYQEYQDSIRNGIADSWGTGHIFLGPGTLLGTDMVSNIQSSMITGGIRPGSFQLDPFSFHLGVLGEGQLDLDFFNLGLSQDSPLTQSYVGTLSTWNFHNVWYVDPIVLDLDGNGIGTTSYKNDAVLFDMENSGSLKRTSWVDENTGILVVPDENGDVTNASQMFSEYYGGTSGANGEAGTMPFVNGFDALFSVDTNKDGAITNSDAIWDQLRVWVDADHDADVDAGELKTLSELGITQLNTGNYLSYETNNGNPITATSSFVMNGNEYEMSDVDLIADGANHTFTALGTGTLNTTVTKNDEGVTTAITTYSENSTADTLLDANNLDGNGLKVNNITGGQGDDKLIANDSGSWLVGAGGSNTYVGGSGDDVFVISATDNPANVSSGGGQDIVMVAGEAGMTINMAQMGVIIAEGGAGDDVIMSGGRTGAYIKGGSGGNDLLIGGAGTDVIVGGSGKNTIIGGTGQSIIHAGPNGDLIYGAAGDSVINAGRGKDTIIAGAGNDVIKVGMGNANVDGGGGENTILFHGSYGDYKIIKTDNGYWIADKVANRDGTIFIKNIEKISFSDIKAISLDSPFSLPVKDTLTKDSSGNTLSRTQAHLISAQQLLANDQSLSSVGELRIHSVSNAIGGTAQLTQAGDILFTPDASFTGIMGFKYTVIDAEGHLAQEALDMATGQTATMKAKVTLATPDIPTDPLAAQQWYLNDANVLPVWKDYTGRGIRIGQFEPGGPFAVDPEILNYNHPDLISNIDTAWYTSQQVAGTLPISFSNHATLVAGIMTAARNGSGAVGIAYNAKIAGEFYDGLITSLDKLAFYDIANNSWSATTNFDVSNFDPNTSESTGDFALANAQYAAYNGRGGKGTVIVESAGNGREKQETAQGSLFNNNRFSIQVGGINQQADLSILDPVLTPFSNPGASLLVSAPASNIANTSQLVVTDQGSIYGNSTDTMNGTSFATPIVSGIIALMLEANPNLGYRDVQEILALSAHKIIDNATTWHTNGATNWNGGGMHASYDYGFGEVDALAAVRLAETWITQQIGANESVVSASTSTDTTISAGSTGNSTLSLASGIYVEHAEVDLNLSAFGRLDDLIVELISPNGTESILLKNNEPDNTRTSLQYTFMSTNHWGEKSNGDWTLRVTNAADGSTVTVDDWALRLYGNSITADDTYFYTNEYADHVANNSARGILNDSINGSTGGKNTINTAAMTEDVSIDLSMGSANLSGATLTIQSPSDFHNLFSGDGNDNLTANNNKSILDGGRGNNTLTGGSGKNLFVVRQRENGLDTIQNFNVAQGDVVDLVGFDSLDFNDLIFTQQGADVAISGLGDNQNILLKNITAASLSSSQFAFQDVFIAPRGFTDSSSSDDVPTAGISTITLQGGFNNTAIADTSNGRLSYTLSGTVYTHDMALTNTFVIANAPVWPDFSNALQGFKPGSDKIDLSLIGGSGIPDASYLYLKPKVYAELNGDPLVQGVEVTIWDGVQDVTLVYLDSIDPTQLKASDFIFSNGLSGPDEPIATSTPVTPSRHVQQDTDGTDDPFLIGSNTGITFTQDGSGNQTAHSSVNYVLPDDINTLELTGESDIIGVGNNNDNTLTGNSTQSTLIGSLGNDTYFINHSGTVIVENAGEGTESVSAAVNYSLGANVENLTLTGGSDINGTGNASNNTITGNPGSNILDGGAGADSLLGGQGNDIYIVDNANDVATESSDQGTDTVQSSVSYQLGANIENLILTGTDALVGTGNALDNVIMGNTGNNALNAGVGNDTYAFQEDWGTDLISADASGTDTVDFSTLTSAVTVNLLSSGGNEAASGSETVNWSNNIIENATGGSGNDTLIGNSSANLLIGNAGDDTLTGAGGNDTLRGGEGDDTYIFADGFGADSLSDSTGADTFDFSSMTSALEYDATTGSVTVGANTVSFNTADTAIESVLGGSGNDEFTGNSTSESFAGGSGNDTYVNSGGADTVDDASGSDQASFVGLDTTDAIWSAVDTDADGNLDQLKVDFGDGHSVTIKNYFADDSNNIVTSTAGTGAIESLTFDDDADVTFADVQTIISSAGLTLTGTSGDDTLIGGAGLDKLTGLDGNDSLDGGTADDTLIGGLGNDAYIVDSAGDVVTENANEGTDTILASVSYTLSANVEALTLSGSSDINATGNTLDNTLIGNSGANILDGSSGADNLTGGLGNDVYIVDNAGDVVTENATEGIDTIQASVSYALSGHVENLTLTGTATDGIGNNLNNLILGNGSANLLNAGNGDDTIQAAGGNDTLNGGLGSDSMLGGQGSDTYIVDSFGDLVIENASEGTDTVQSSITYTLGNNIENLTLIGTDTIHATGNAANNVLIGNEGANSLSGGDGNDTLQAAGGHDTLIGGIGIDSMAGGQGNDTYVVDHVNDIVTENAGEGIDSVQTSVSFALGSNIENLTLSGSGVIDGIGNNANNTITGNEASNLLSGGNGDDTLLGAGGDDTLNGGVGIDSLTGGQGHDVYSVDNAGDVIVENADEGADTVQTSISYTLGANLENLTLTGTGNIDGNGNAVDNLIIGNEGANSLTGGNGNDTLLAAGGNDTLNGGSGNEALLGGSGNDVYQGFSASSGADTINDASGADQASFVGTDTTDATWTALDTDADGRLDQLKVDFGSGHSVTIKNYFDDTSAIVGDSEEGTGAIESLVFDNDADVTFADVQTLIASAGQTFTGTLDNDTLTGDVGNDVLVGLAGNDNLDGDAGADTMLGGLGNDTYVVADTDDIVTEATSEGVDLVQASVSYTLSANVENLTLTGSSNINGIGNSLSNTITGNSGNNSLDGSTGSDSLIGGSGDDSYIVDNVGDVITENASEGTDTVQASIAYSLGSDVENLTLTGAANINGTGNALTNVITGNSGHNTLDGGAGADTLIGSLGNDTYVVDDAGDVVNENASEGTDTIQASVSYTLSSNVEHLTLTGASNINATGNTLDNVITGNSGNNSLDGGTGNDSLAGGSGDDVYLAFSATSGADTINDASGTDQASFAGADTTDATWTAEDSDADGHLDQLKVDFGGGHSVTIKDYFDDTAADILSSGAGTGAIESLVFDDDANVSFTDVQAIISATGVFVPGTSGADTLNGGAGRDTLMGGDGNDSLNGGAAADSLVGGDGDDIYVVDDAGDLVIENTNEGTDTVQSSVTHTLSANVENLTLTGSSNINGIGNALDNTITGNTGNNNLDGGIGADSLTGGSGDDTYIVDNVNDVVTENSVEGTDLVQASVSYTLASNVENLTLTGSSDINGTGNTEHNTIIGNNGANALSGGDGNDTLQAADGNDTLDGGVSTDSMIGGLGDDIYVVDNAGDTVVENASEGTDTVQASITYTLGSDVENLTLTGSSNLNATGNTLNNIIIGNSGNNSLDGGTGNDSLAGGSGDDTYLTFSATSGTDTINDASGTDQASFAGSDTTDATWAAEDGDGDGNLDQLKVDFGAGHSVTIQNYFDDSSANILASNAGTGAIESLVFDDDASVTFAEVQTMLSSAGQFFSGTNGDDTLTGGSGIDTLVGGEGNDSLDGGSAADNMLGGLGDDTYAVDDASDLVIENAAEGTDTVQTSLSSYTLSTNVENLTLTGSSNINGIGNEGNNTITGNSGANSLSGGSGNDTLLGEDGADTLDGGSGADSLAAGSGNDTYTAFTVTSGRDTVNDASGTDVADFGTLNTTDAVWSALDSNADGFLDQLKVDFGNGNTVFINNYFNNDASTVTASTAGAGLIETLDFTDTDLAFNDAKTLLIGPSGVESLLLEGADGVDDSLTGDIGNDTLIGHDGQDTLTGGAGNDLLEGNNGWDRYAFANGWGNDTINSEWAGGDWLDFSAVTSNLTINMTAGAGNEITDGTNTVNWTAGNTFEYVLGGSGNDSVTGDASDDNFTGNGGNDTLNGEAGADWLDGGAGDDLLKGGADNDVYYNLDNSTGADIIDDAAGTEDRAIFDQGTTDATWTAEDSDADGKLDQLKVDFGNGHSVTIQNYFDDTAASLANSAQGTGFIETLSFTNDDDLSFSEVQRLIYQSAGTVQDGTSGDESLTGTAGSDVLNALDGTDTLTGGAGNDILNGQNGWDTYLFENTWGKDIVGDDFAGGDTVDFSAVTSNLTINMTGSNSYDEVSDGSNTLNWANETLFEYVVSGSGDDSITGSTHADDITGSGGNDTISAGDGDDGLDGGTGNDLLKGGADNDLYYGLGSTTGTDIIDDAAGTADQASFDQNTGDATWTAEDSDADGKLDQLKIDFGSGNSVTIKNYFDNTAASLANSVAGNGFIETLSFNDNNNLSFSEVQQLIYQSAGTVQDGTSGDESLTGTAGNDVLNAYDGNDTLAGGAGNDVLNGQNGWDTYLFADGWGQDIIGDDYAGGDFLDMSSVTEDLTIQVTGSNSHDEVTDGTNTVNWADDIVLEYIIGGSGNDSITGSDEVDDIAGGDGNDNIQGGTNDDWLDGGAGNDTLDGGAGIDTMIGGAGDDLYILDNASDDLNENASEGTDTVQSSVSYTLASNIENLTLIGTANLSGTGNSAANMITGNSGNNTLDGGSGNDILLGGSGDDTYLIDTVSDVVTENASEGIDTVQSSTTYTLASHVENLTLAGSSNIHGTGNTLDNILTGNSGDNFLTGSSGNDTLDGESGDDTMAGGTGDDVYYVTDYGDITTENSSEGIDTVYTSIGWTLDANIENATILETGGAINATGNDLDNALLGNSYANYLTGGSGNDTLNGGSAGTDELEGGAGDDTYIINHTGVTVYEWWGEGTDTIQASVSSTLSDNVENLTLTGASTIGGTGNNSDNVITGNSADNIIDGSGGDDTLIGGLGNDTYIVQNSGDVVTENSDEGTDTIEVSFNYTLAANVENLTLSASAGSINGTGNGLDNYLLGNLGNNSLTGGSGNDTLDGGAGTDTLLGGLGDDTYQVDSTSDTITENADEGTDTVQSSVSYTLGTNLENLTLTDSANLNGTGNDLANVLTGNGGNNSLTGGSGNDTLDGGVGTDTLNGEAGDDTYIVDSSTDTVSEASSSGLDTVISSVSFTLGANVDNLTLSGSGNITGTGNTLNNTLIGNSGNNTLVGGAGNDTYQFGTGIGEDLIQDSGDSDTVLFDSSISLSNVVFFQTGTGDLQIGYTNSSGDLITVQGQSTSSTAVERFELSNGQYMTDADVNQILSDMASYAANNSISLTSLEDVKNDANLVAIVNGGWHS